MLLKDEPDCSSFVGEGAIDTLKKTKAFYTVGYEINGLRSITKQANGKMTQLQG